MIFVRAFSLQSTFAALAAGSHSAMRAPAIPVATIGPYCGSAVPLAYAAAPSMPLVSFGAGASTFSATADYPSFVRILTSTLVATEIMLEFLSTRGVNSFALVYAESSFGAAGATDIADMASSFGLTVSHRISFAVPSSVAVLEASMKPLQGAAGVPFIFLFADSHTYFLHAAEASFNLGLHGSGQGWLVTTSAYDAALLTAGQANAKVRPILSNSFFGLRTVQSTQAMLDFAALYATVFGPSYTVPSIYASPAFDAGTLNCASPLVLHSAPCALTLILHSFSRQFSWLLAPLFNRTRHRRHRCPHPPPPQTRRLHPLFGRARHSASRAP